MVSRFYDHNVLLMHDRKHFDHKPMFYLSTFLREIHRRMNKRVIFSSLEFIDLNA